MKYEKSMTTIDKTSRRFLTVEILLITWASLSVLPVQSLSCVSSIYNLHHYSYCSDHKDRDDAQSVCSLLPNAMRLAVLETQTDFDFWHLWFKSIAPVRDVWIGAKFSGAQDAWWWDEDFPVSLTFFSPSPPNTTGVKDGACLSFSSDNQQYLGEVSCKQKRGFLCQEDYTIEISTASPDTQETTEPPTTQSSSSSKATTEEPQPANQGNNQGFCECGCSENITNTPKTKSEQQAYLEKRRKEIETELFVDTKGLSSSVRRRKSAEDERESAQSVGYLGVAMLVLVFGSVFVIDIPSLWISLKHCSTNC